jgi:hypothetical protein
MSGVVATKQSSKPTKSLERFLNVYLAKPVYARTKQNKPIIKRSAPKIIVKSLKELDDKSLKEGYQKKLIELRSKYDSLLPTDAAGRASLQEQIDRLQSLQSKLYSNLKNISSFDFVKEIEACNLDVSKITDPELRGYIEILGSKQLEKETIKRLIDKFKFEKIQKKNVNEEFKGLFKDNKYRLKIFNSSFTHPDMKNKQGELVYRKLKHDSKPETMKLYLKRFCKYFDDVLSMLVSGNKAEVILPSILNKHIQLHQMKVNGNEVWQKCVQYKPEDKIKYTKDEKELINLYTSVKTILEELKEYPNLAAEYPNYNNKVKMYEMNIRAELKTTDSQSFLQSLVSIIKSFEPLELNDIILGDFLKAANIRMKPEIKKKLRSCIINQQLPEVVEQQYSVKIIKKNGKDVEKHEPKVMNLLPNQFLSSDVNVFETVDTMYDIDKYAKIGRIVKLNDNAPKSWYVALALRILKECKYIIQDAQLNGQSQILFAM